MMHEGYQMKLRSSFYLAHYLICRGGEFGPLILNPQLDFNSTLHDASLLMHPKPCQDSKFPVTALIFQVFGTQTLWEPSMVLIISLGTQIGRFHPYVLHPMT